MRKFVTDHNIARYKALLERETASDKRNLLLTLLAEEEVKQAGRENERRCDSLALRPRS
jgi:hypothetical protein